MKKNIWKVFFCLFSVFVLFCTFTSCSTTKTIDIAEITEPVLAQRPDNGTLEVWPGPIYEVYQIMQNMNTYLHAWQMWQTYAESLEETIIVIGDRLSE